MKQRRGRFLTFLFALLPGAGHMFMGFMKTGISLMSAFFFIIFLASWLNIGPVLFILPVLWFYSFFDCLNKYYLNDEEFEQLEDCYLFSIDTLFEGGNNLFKRFGSYLGILLILFGIYLMWDNLLITPLWPYIPDSLYGYLIGFKRAFPQLVIGVTIIVIGIKLIVRKKREIGRGVEEDV